MRAISRLFEREVGRLLFVAFLAVPTFGVVYALVGGTELLMWFGLSRSVAGTVVTAIVVLGVLVGLGAFARYAIDW